MLYEFLLVDIDTGQLLDRHIVDSKWTQMTWRPESSDARPGAIRIEFRVIKSAESESTSEDHEV